MTNPTTIVHRAIEATPSHYWWKCCAMRAEHSETRLGSYLRRMTPRDVDAMVRRLQWETYAHPHIATPAEGFVAAPLPGVGVLGVVPLAVALQNRARLVWDDSKDTGLVELVWRDAPPSVQRAQHITMLIGPPDKDERPENVVWSFFPGDPVRVRRIPRRVAEALPMLGTPELLKDLVDADVTDLHGQICSAALARELRVPSVKLD